MTRTESRSPVAIAEDVAANWISTEESEEQSDGHLSYHDMEDRKSCSLEAAYRDVLNRDLDSIARDVNRLAIRLHEPKKSLLDPRSEVWADVNLVVMSVWLVVVLVPFIVEYLSAILFFILLNPGKVFPPAFRSFSDRRDCCET